MDIHWEAACEETAKLNFNPPGAIKGCKIQLYRNIEKIWYIYNLRKTFLNTLTLDEYDVFKERCLSRKLYEHNTPRMIATQFFRKQSWIYKVEMNYLNKAAVIVKQYQEAK